MHYKFQLPGFPASNFEMEISMWTGKSKLLMNNTPIEQSKEKGKPFLIPTLGGTITKAFPKQSLPEFVPELKIDGVRNQIVEPLKWYQTFIGGLPIALLFIGGAVRGVIGVVSALTIFNIFRQEGTEPLKYYDTPQN